MRAALYLRVSTEEQAKEGFSVSAQRERLEAYCASQGWTIADTYADEGFSGKNLDRPEMQRMLMDISSGLVDVVLTWKLDRLSRRQVDALHLIEDVLAPRKVGLRSATEPFDTTTPAGMAMVGMLAVFAQLELATIIERVRFGYHQRLSLGKWSGQPPYGFRYGHSGVLEEDPETAPWVRAIFREIRERSLPDLASWLQSQGAPSYRGGEWNFSTLAKILHNRAYIGERRTQAGWMRSGHKGIITEEEWLLARETLSSRAKGFGHPRRGQPSLYLLAGITFCATCGARMAGHKSTGQRRYYVCDTTRRTGQRCGPGYVRKETLEARVAEELLASASVERRDRTQERRRDSERLADVDARIGRLIEALEAGAVPVSAVRDRMDALQRERAAIERARKEGDALATDHQIRAMWAALPKMWGVADPGQRQEVLRTLVGRIEVRADASVVLDLL